MSMFDIDKFSFINAICERFSEINTFKYKYFCHNVYVIVATRILQVISTVFSYNYYMPLEF